MKTARQLLQETPSLALFAVSANTSVFDALKLMAEQDIGAVLVMDGETLLGMMSERDYARKVILHGKASVSTPVSEIMTRRVAFVRPADTVDQCMAVMAAARVRHVPVMDGSTVLGVISITDMVREQIADQQFSISQLEHYIYDIRS